MVRFWGAFPLVLWMIVGANMLKVFEFKIKKKHAYPPVSYIGRKTVENILGCKIKKRKKLVE